MHRVMTLAVALAFAVLVVPEIASAQPKVSQSVAAQAGAVKTKLTGPFLTQQDIARAGG